MPNAGKMKNEANKIADKNKLIALLKKYQKSL
jgi:tRNA-dihydrouridine synthase B